jgi:hypothetical protein
MITRVTRIPEHHQVPIATVRTVITQDIPALMAATVIPPALAAMVAAAMVVTGSSP